MRRLLAVAVLGASAFGGAAVAEPTCVPVHAGQVMVGVCVEYVCVDICAPELHVDPQCQESIEPPSALVSRVCNSIDAKYYVV